MSPGQSERPAGGALPHGEPLLPGRLADWNRTNESVIKLNQFILCFFLDQNHNLSAMIQDYFNISL